jgi:hypothetical protein
MPEISGGVLSANSSLGGYITLDNIVGQLSSGSEHEPPKIRWLGYEKNENGIITRGKKLQFGKSVNGEIQWEDVPITEE